MLLYLFLRLFAQISDSHFEMTTKRLVIWLCLFAPLDSQLIRFCSNCLKVSTGYYKDIYCVWRRERPKLSLLYYSSWDTRAPFLSNRFIFQHLFSDLVNPKSRRVDNFSKPPHRILVIWHNSTLVEKKIHQLLKSYEVK